MGRASGKDKVFLFLQGPHGPFFAQLAKVLEKAGAKTIKVGFNQGDCAFQRRRIALADVGERRKSLRRDIP
ncbi:MAG: hypothetical protein O3A08_12500, partial [Proteobacteria bacterium]|nr:hypothetical protein [Pseudomonadota bacterium]